MTFLVGWNIFSMARAAVCGHQASARLHNIQRKVHRTHLGQGLQGSGFGVERIGSDPSLQMPMSKGLDKSLGYHESP